MADVEDSGFPGEPGHPGRPGTHDQGGAGGAGGTGGSGGLGSPGGPGGEGGEGGRFITEHRAQSISRVSFAVLVLLIPLMAGIGWMEHVRREDLGRLQTATAWLLYDNTLNSCERGNGVREKQNTVISVLRKEFQLDIPLTPLVDCAVVVSKPTQPRPNTGG